MRAPAVNRVDTDAMPPTEPLALPTLDSPAPRSRAVWVEVEAGLHVANTAATFVGTVTVTDTGFDATDGLGRHRGTFTTLDAAKSALESCAEAVLAAVSARSAALRHTRSADGLASRRARRATPPRGAVAPVV